MLFQFQRNTWQPTLAVIMLTLVSTPAPARSAPSTAAMGVESSVEVESSGAASHQLSRIPDNNSPVLAQNVLGQSSPNSVIQISPAISQIPTQSVSSLKSTPSVDQLEADPLSSQSTPAITPKSMAQVTAVTQLSDAKPTDWAYQALQSLVEKYGCIAGYPDGTFRGTRSATRFELAAALNACLDVISDRFATKEDLEALRKLQVEFAAELATLRGRVDSLEGRVAVLEGTQFSTTTKLMGVANFSLAGVLGGPSEQNNVTVQDRLNLNLLTSFTGKDLLVTSLFAGNVPPLGVGFVLPPTVAAGLPIPSAEGTLATQFAANTNNNLVNLILQYSFPVGKRLRVDAISGFGIFNSIAPVLNPYFADNFAGTGSLSAFGQGNAIYGLGSGTGIGLNYQLNKQLQLTGAYLANGLDANQPLNGGLFGGGYAALGQLTWRPTKQLGFAATYLNSYYQPGRFGFNYNFLAVTGTAVANTLAGQTRLALNPGGLGLSAVVANSYGAQFTYQPIPKFAVSGWFGATYSTLIGQGEGEIFNYALTFAFPDLGRQGNLLGIVIGAEPYLTSFQGGNPQPFSVDIPLHIEAFYKYQVTDNISVTPGLIWLTAPNQDNANPDAVIATVRTTFTF